MNFVTKEIIPRMTLTGNRLSQIAYDLVAYITLS